MVAAHDAGARVLLLEKMPDPGGISISSAGVVRISRDADASFNYLKTSNADTTPEHLLKVVHHLLVHQLLYQQQVVDVEVMQIIDVVVLVDQVVEEWNLIRLHLQVELILVDVEFVVKVLKVVD